MYNRAVLSVILKKTGKLSHILSVPEHIYNPITAMGFSAMFTFQLNNTRGKHCRHPIATMGVVDTFRH